MSKLNLILLIDDSEDDNEFHQIIIGKTKITVDIKSITDSRIAQNYFENSFSSENKDFPVPNLVFIDINMPAMNGFELLDKIREIPDPNNHKQKMQIFMLTGSLNPDDRALAAEKYAGLITGFHIKPLTVDIFLNILKTHFSD